MVVRRVSVLMLLSVTMLLATACSFGASAPTATPTATTSSQALETATPATALTPSTTAPASVTPTTSGTRTPTPRRGTPTPSARASASPWGSPLPVLTTGQVYQDPQRRFSFTIPATWTQVQAAGAEVAFQSPVEPGAVPATVNIVLEKLPSASVSLDDYDRAGEANLKQQFSDYKQVSLTKVTVAGHPAYKRIYTATIANRLLQLQQVYLIENDTAYVISCGAPAETFSRYTPIFDQISGTFKIGP